MENRMINSLYEIIKSKIPSDETSDIDKGLIRFYINSLDIVRAWEFSGLDENLFDEWFDMYTEPFRFLDYIGCVKLLSYRYEIECFDGTVTELSDDKRLNNSNRRLAAERRYRELVCFCEDSAYLCRKNYVKGILAQIDSVIKG